MNLINVSIDSTDHCRSNVRISISKEFYFTRQQNYEKI